MPRVPVYRRLSIMVGVVALFGFTVAAHGNDRSLRGIMIPPSSCQPNFRASNSFACEDPPTTDKGYFTGNAWVGYNCTFVLACPLPINNIELGGTSTDNDITKFRVHYRDPSTASQVIVYLIKSQVVGGTFVSSSVCGGQLPATTINPATTIEYCPHDVADRGTFYHFEVILKSYRKTDAPWFLGIDFPQ